MHGLLLSLEAQGPARFPGDAPVSPSFDPATGLSDWFVPSLEDWKAVYANRRVVEAALQRSRGAPLGGQRHWSSTAVAYNTSRGSLVANRWSYLPASGQAWESTVDTELCVVRLVRAF